ncbi:MAG: methyltransferase domain-containing protein, partial [Desulfobacterales bacterium]|nr:methyltransferase domain-containing protein [Desulfobacterales bacterium]
MNKEKSAFFDCQADEEWADAAYTIEEIAKVNQLIQQTGIKHGSRIIEPGCGTGRLTEILEKTIGDQGHLIAFDISSKMIEKCSKRLYARHNVSIHLTAVEDFVFEKQSVDYIVCHQVFPHFDDKKLAVRLLSKALKPDGKFIVFHFKNSSWINDIHRKASAVVIHDMLPSDQEMSLLFKGLGMKIETLRDDDQGYFLSAIFDKNERNQFK